jgi:hypothetical protein
MTRGISSVAMVHAAVHIGRSTEIESFHFHSTHTAGISTTPCRVEEILFCLQQFHATLYIHNLIFKLLLNLE